MTFQMNVLYIFILVLIISLSVVGFMLHKSRSTTKQSQKNVTLRKQILNCPQDQIFDLLKSQGLLSDDEFIPSSLSLKERK